MLTYQLSYICLYNYGILWKYWRCRWSNVLKRERHLVGVRAEKQGGKIGLKFISNVL